MGQITLPILLKMPSLHPVRRSVDSLTALLADATDQFVEGVHGVLAGNILRSLIAGENIADLIVGEAVNRSARGARELQAFEINPSDGYLELFAAVAAHRQKHVVFSHGWPLSVSPDSTATVSGPVSQGES